MNFQEALELSWAKHGGHELPWEVSKDTYTVIFQHGWHAHMEALKQPDLFPGTWHKDPVSANEAQRAEHPPCKREAAGSSPAVGSIYYQQTVPLSSVREMMKDWPASITAEDIYAAWPVKKARGAAIKAIERAMKKENPETLLAAVKELAACYAKWPVAERQYLPMCSTFMNQERWSDDRATWRRGADATTSQFSKTH